jgi:MSHA biogenesis protein MshQ
MKRPLRLPWFRWPGLFLILCLTLSDAGAEITVVDSTFRDENNPGATFHVDVPAVDEGDVMIVQITTRAVASVGTPPGWTLLRQDGDNTLAQRLYVRVAQAVEPTEYLWDVTRQSGAPGGQVRLAGAMIGFRGVDPLDPVGAADGQSGSGAVLTAPSVAAGSDGSLLLALFATANGGADLSLPEEMNPVLFQQIGAGPNGATIRVVGELHDAGATGVRTSTSSVNTDWAAQSLTLNPSDVAGPHHIRLLHDGQGLTCAPETVTVEACADEDCTTLYMDPVDVALDTAPGGGIWTPNPVTMTDGSAQVTLRYNTPGSFTLQVTATDPAAETSARCFNGDVETCAMSFHESGFVFDFDAAQPILAGRIATPVTVSALKADPADPVSCAPAFTGPRAVGMWFDFSDPDAGTFALSVDGIALGTAAPGTPVVLGFDANAQAVVGLEYHDAGMLNLHARYEGDDEEEGLVMTGSGQFLVRPAGLCVDTPEANSECDPASPACSVFRRAGESFELRVSAVAWRDGDGGDLCMDRATRITPNFRMADIPLASGLVAPSLGQPGVLAVSSVTLGAADAGVVIIPDQEISEVGVFRISASPAPGAYHGVGVSGGTSANLGRFTPYDFQVSLDNSPEFQASCNESFTYMSQWFGYAVAPQVRITARNADGEVTQNYDGDWWRLPGIVPVYEHADDPDPLPDDVAFTEDGTHDAIDCTAGGCQGEVTVGFGGQFTYDRDGDPVNPVNGAVRVSFMVEDDDEVTFMMEDDDGEPFAAPFVFTVDFEGGNDEQRWGRLEMQNAHGPELLPLTVPMFTTYFLGGTFRLNTDDNCTLVNTADVDLDIQLSGGTTTADVLSTPASAGRLDVSLSAPGAGNTGYVDLTPDLSVTTGADLPWLTFDWDGDGNPRGPEARATFGVFGGNERHIYIRELP